MFRIVLGTFVGAIIIYFWLFASWMLLGIHNSSFRPLPSHDDVTSALGAKGLKTGAYHAPSWPESPDDEAAMAEFNAQHEAGPIFTIFYHKEGLPVMGPKTFACAIALDVASAAIVAIALWCAAPRLTNYFCRVGFVAMLGLLVALMGHVSYWVWMLFPVDYTIAMCADQIVGWLLVGLALAAIIKPPKDKPNDGAQSAATA